MEESARSDENNPYGPQWDIAFAVYRNEADDSGKSRNLLVPVAHSKPMIYNNVTTDCILEKGSYSIVPLSFNHFHSAGSVSSIF